MNLSAAVFFDRDGIVNQRPIKSRYVETPEAFHFQPVFAEVLRLVTSRGYASFIVTNQRGVGLGLMTQASLDQIHEKLQRILSDQGVAVNGIHVCTATDDAHPDRKPNPGLLLGAARDHSLDLHHSWMIGDTTGDVLAGRHAGCRTVLVSAAPWAPLEAEFHVPDLDRLLSLLQRELLPRPVPRADLRSQPSGQTGAE